MATTITHALVAGAFASVAPADLPRVRLALVLAVLSAMPDLDVVGFHHGIAYGHPLGHRGFTHSLLFAALVALVVPSIAFRDAPPGRRVLLVAMSFVAVASHGMLDAFTDAGLGIGFLIPFDDTRYFAPWRPLETSPLSVSAFFSGPALAILASEAKWVLAPVAALLGLWHLVRFLLARR